MPEQRQIRTIDAKGYVTELWLQAEDTEDGESLGYPELGEYEIAIPIPEGLYEPVRFVDGEWVSQITEEELYEIAYREKHRELVQAATQEFVNTKPGYTETERVLQVLYDLYAMWSTGSSPGMSGEANDLKNVFDTLYGKLVALDQAQTKKDVEGIKWT